MAGIRRADDDSFDDVAAGAPYYDRGSRRNAGKVIVYSSKRGERLWQKFGRRKNDWFGWDVDEARDPNCDGYDDVLVGANTVGMIQHVGVLRGLIQTRAPLGKWKDRLMRDPTGVMAAYLGVTQG